MKCREILARLSEYLDRELPPDDTRVIDRHFADCPMCVAFVNTLRKTVDIFRGWGPSAAIPDEFSHSLHDRIRAEMKDRDAPSE